MNRVLAIPTANAISFAFILGVMWYVGMAQGNGVAYLLFFMLLGVLLVSVPKTFLNLTGLKVTVDSPQPVFAGQEISLPVELVNESNRVRYAISVALSGGKYPSELVDELPASQAARTLIRFPATRRGIQEITRLGIASVYPLGWLKAWRTVPVKQHVLVYPEPAGDTHLPHSSTGTEFAGKPLQLDGDDFAGVRPYRLGEAQRHIDWKAVARGQPLMSKQFAREEGGALALRFDAVKQEDVEARLSQLALWVITAERARLPYSLHLPTMQIPTGIGETHYHQCLKALACYR